MHLNQLSEQATAKDIKARIEKISGAETAYLQHEINELDSYIKSYPALPENKPAILLHLRDYVEHLETDLSGNFAGRFKFMDQLLVTSLKNYATSGLELPEQEIKFVDYML